MSNKALNMVHKGLGLRTAILCLLYGWLAWQLYGQVTDSRLAGRQNVANTVNALHSGNPSYNDAICYKTPSQSSPTKP